MAENPPPLMVVYVNSLIFFFTWNYLATLCHIELPTIPVHPGFSGVCVTRSLVLCVCFVDRCLSFCNFLLAIVLSVLRYTDSDYPFGIFKLVLLLKNVIRLPVVSLVFYPTTAYRVIFLWWYTYQKLMFLAYCATQKTPWSANGRSVILKNYMIMFELKKNYVP